MSSDPNSTYKESISYILSCVHATLEKQLDGKVQEIMESINGSNKVFVYGVGRSGLVAQSFAMRLVQLGLKAHFIGEITTPIVTDKDVVILISNTGETMSAIQTGNIARRVGAKVVTITATPGSKLGHVGNVNVILDIECNVRRNDLAPLGTLFENASQLFLDGLVAQMMRERKETERSMRARHAIWV